MKKLICSCSKQILREEILDEEKSLKTKNRIKERKEQLEKADRKKFLEDAMLHHIMLKDDVAWQAAKDEYDVLVGT